MGFASGAVLTLLVGFSLSTDQGAEHTVSFILLGAFACGGAAWAWRTRSIALFFGWFGGIAAVVLGALAWLMKAWSHGPFFQ
jgi:hypothetical protein